MVWIDCLDFKNRKTESFVPKTRKKRFELSQRLRNKRLGFMVHNFNKNNDFQTILINSKKIPKNIKFGLQAHFNID